MRQDASDARDVVAADAADARDLVAVDAALAADLVKKVGTMTEAVAGLADKVTIVEENEADRERAEQGRRTIVRNLGIVAVVALLAAVLALWAVFRVRQAVDDIESTRTESRVASCVQDNVRIDQHNLLTEAVRGILTLSNVPNPTRTPEQQARADAFFAQANTLLNATVVAQRDCTPAGLDIYFTTTTQPTSGG